MSVKFIKPWHAVALSLTMIMLSAWRMLSAPLSDDQITYWKRALVLLNDSSHEIWWEPASTFSYLLALLHRWGADPIHSFIIVYVACAVLYFVSMYWAMCYYIKERASAILIALVSLIPHYTLGMTYWGFSSFEFVKARILIMPLVPMIIRVFLEWQDRRRVWIAYALCGLAAMLNFEAIFLGAILMAYTAISWIRNQIQSNNAKIGHLIGVVVFSATAVAIPIYYEVMIRLFGSPQTYFEIPVYEHLASILNGYLSQLSDADYLKLRWLAMDKALWWTLFPPRITDIIFFLLEHLVLLIPAYVGWAAFRRNNQPESCKLEQFVLSVLLVSYGYQLLRWSGKYYFGWPPHTLEEVRAFKFVLFPVYIWAGYFLYLVGRRKNGWIQLLMVFVLMLTPLQILRSTPYEIKQRIMNVGSGILKEEKIEYLAKAIEFRDPQIHDDVYQINATLRRISSEDPDAVAYVMTTEHDIELSGYPVLISYQVKRTGGFRGLLADASERSDYLVLWHVAYSEVRNALESGDSQLCVSTAKKYQCRYLVSEYLMADESLQTLYKGSELHLYRVV